MKLAAHPLVVAVALGVLPAHALADDRDDEGPGPCTDCGDTEAVPGERSMLDVPRVEAEADDPAIDALLDALRELPTPEAVDAD